MYETTTKASIELVKYVLTYYGYLIMLIFGNIGNYLNIVLFLRKKLRATSCNNYFLVSAFSNLIALNVGIISLFYIGSHLWKITTIYCKIESYIMNISLQISRFLILMACFDRYALCSTNAYLRKFCNVRIARHYVIPSIIFICFFMPLHILILMSVENNSCVLRGIAELSNSIYGIIMIGTMPPFLMLVFSFLIFHNLKLRKRRRQIYPSIVNNVNSLVQDNRHTQVKDEQVFAMLLIQVFAYVVSSTPYTVARLYLVLKVETKDGILHENNPSTALILFVTDMLRFVCPSTSFYLFIFVSNLYRKEMKLIISNIHHRCCTLWKKNNDHHHHHHHNTIAVRNSRSIKTNKLRQQQNPVNVQLDV